MMQAHTPILVHSPSSPVVEERAPITPPEYLTHIDTLTAQLSHFQSHLLRNG